ncbi:uncharacterized protein [Hetaerina americana]|uniref:uncharacterized protein n=1 Tax=Hetaerina americana TaxID=62018 RepID=UPI003A7F4374
MGRQLLFIAFGALISAAGSEFLNKDMVPAHYEYLEKFNCVKKVDVFLDRSTLFTYSSEFLSSFPGANNFDCRTTVFSKTKGTGIIAMIQKLEFRKVSETCRDYVRFAEDPTDRCGDILTGLKLAKSGKLPPPPEFISAYSGLFTSHLSINMEHIPGMSVVDSRKRFASPGAVVTPSYSLNTDIHVHAQPALEYEDELLLIMAYTGFQDCEDTKFRGQMFNCGYGVCILDIFVNDGVVNCPFGDCRDEGGCENVIQTSPIFTGKWNVTGAIELPEAGVDSQPGAKWGEKEIEKKGHHPNPSATVPLAYALQKSSLAKDGVKDIGEELRRHNNIMQHISSLLERGVLAAEATVGHKDVKENGGGGEQGAHNEEA